jgi:hypothetical protein
MTAPIRNLYRALTLVSVGSALALAAKAAPFGQNFQIVTNLDGFEAARFTLTTSYNTQFVYTVALGVRPEFTVSTNVGGIVVFLSADTNRVSGRNPVVLLSLLNVTASSPSFPRIAGGEPLFGYCLVSNIMTSQSIRTHRRPPQDPISVTGGSLLPGNREEFPIPLGSAINAKEQGRYALRFHGKFHSAEPPNTEVEFETPPLSITVERAVAR